MESTITIEGKVFGQKRPLFADWRMSLPPEAASAAEGITLRALITGIVREEVHAFRERQEERRLVRALTKADIERGLTKGKIDMGGCEVETEADPQSAVEAALLAFEDGLYYVFVDEEQALDLDASVAVRPDSRVTFLRLVALAGG